MSVHTQVCTLHMYIYTDQFFTAAFLPLCCHSTVSKQQQWGLYTARISLS